MSKYKPTIDILLASCNGAFYIDEQIASIQIQTFEDWRLMISDDCSVDETVEIVKNFELIDSRIVLASEGIKHGSAAKNFMHLLANSSAPYVMLCDQDDIWLPDKIELTFSRMQEMEYSFGKDVPLLVFSDMAVVDKRLQLVNSSFELYSNFDPSRVSLRYLLEQNVAAGCTMMLNRALVNYCSNVEIAHKIIMHDWYIALVASAIGHISYIDTALSLYRQHDNNTVGAQEYTLLSKHSSNSIRLEKYRARIVQANLIYHQLYGQFNIEDDEYIQEYLAIDQAKSLTEGIKHLIRSKCWKNTSMRQILQIYNTLNLVQDNKQHDANSQDRKNKL